MLLKVLKEFQPEYLALCLDEKAPTFRHEAYREYKATRPPMPEDLAVQLPYIREVAEALGLSLLSIPGYEADDLIATLATKFLNPIIIIAGDRDLLALVSERVYIWDPMREKVIDPQTVVKRYGLPPEKIPELRALVGDPSDNIPGVKGIGEKTAAKLIKSFGSVEALYQRLSEVTPLRIRKLLEEGREAAFLSRKLIELETSAPVPADLEAYRLREPDLNKLRAIFRKLEFKKLLMELPPEREIPAEKLLEAKELPAEVRKVERVAFFAFKTPDLFGKVRIQVLGVATPEKAFYLPEEALSEIKGFLSQDGPKVKIFYDLKEVYHLLGEEFSPSGELFDVKLAAWLLEPVKKTYELEALSEEYLGVRLSTKLTGSGAAERAYVLQELYRELRPALTQSGLEKLYFEVEVPLARILYKMERFGVKVDLAYLRKLSQRFKEEIKTIEEEIFRLAGEPFNLRSGRELARILFEKLKLPRKKKTPKGTGYSTDMEVLSELARLHPLPERVLRYRTLYKLLSTYIEPLPRLVDPATGRVHTTFHQTGTATGRLSSSDPNLQNIPIKGEEGEAIRRAFVAEEGWLLLSADYSQIELRLLAHFSGDENLKKAFLEGRDIHAATAAEIFGVREEEVTLEMRRLAKVINFGIAYGMSPYGLSKELDIDYKQAQAFIDRYFERYPGVKAYMEGMIEEARDKGYVTTLLGRRRPIPDIKSGERAVREFAERTAINTPIQGSGADLIKLAMLRIDRSLLVGGFKTRLILQVHDELLFEVPEEEIEEVVAIIRKDMEEVYPLSVPLKVNLSWGKTWAEAKA